MQIKDVRLKSPETTFKFSGDPKVQWFIRDMNDSNLPLPQVVGMANGAMTLAVDPRCNNAVMRLGFYTEGESTLAAEVDEEIKPSRKVSFSMVTAPIRKFDSMPWWLKYFVVFPLGFLGFAFLWALLDSKYDTGPAMRMYEKLNLANAAGQIGEFMDNKDEKMAIAMNDHPVYESPMAKEIEEDIKKEYGIEFSFESMFAYLGNGEFLMKDIMQSDGEAMLMEQGEAEDECEKVNAYLPTAKMLEANLSKLGISASKSVPEWTSESNGWISDDYVIYMKRGEFPDGAHKQGGMVFGDAEDVKAGARCMFKATDFKK